MWVVSGGRNDVRFRGENDSANGALGAFYLELEDESRDSPFVHRPYHSKAGIEDPFALGVP